MLRSKNRLTWADVTPQATYLNRRKFLAGGTALAAGGIAGPSLAEFAKSSFSTDEEPNSFDDATEYNNFYEFGTDKGDPARYAGALTTDPWSVKIDGLVDKPGSYDLADLTKDVDMQERIYRLRCVEAWSMVIPWIGFELNTILNRVGVQSGAKYVAFETLMRPEEMRGQRLPYLDWPYREGLRLDEAMHPLTILSTGMYGQDLPNQNGAPLRLVVPWKYGYKSIKSIVRITLTDTQPDTSWNMSIPNEYGFYSNVNPEVDHPRWSQATERRVGSGLFADKLPTLFMNGYGEEVGDLYAGMDLRKFH